MSMTRKADWPPRGERVQRRARANPSTLSERRLTCVVTVENTVRLPMSCSNDRTLEPRSSFQAASLVTILSTTAAKAVGKTMAAYITYVNLAMNSR